MIKITINISHVRHSTYCTTLLNKKKNISFFKIGFSHRAMLGVLPKSVGVDPRVEEQHVRVGLQQRVTPLHLVLGNPGANVLGG